MTPVARRLVQGAVDLALTGVVFFAVLITATVARLTWLVVADFALLLALSLTVHVGIPSRTAATPGMHLLGLRIVTTAGGVPGVPAYGVRWLLMVADGALFGLVGAILIVCTPRHQRLGDLVADTLVVRRPSR